MINFRQSNIKNSFFSTLCVQFQIVFIWNVIATFCFTDFTITLKMWLPCGWKQYFSGEQFQKCESYKDT